MQPTRITLKDIARETGVDVSTVSRSLSGSYGIHTETRERVLAIAAQLNYRSNRVARGPAVKTHSIALIVNDIRNPFFADVARGAEDAAFAANSDLVLCNSDLNAEKQMHYIRSLIDKRVDGILMNSVGTLDRAQQEFLSLSGVPVVLLNRAKSQSNFSSVIPDNTTGGFLAGAYLVELGHRHIVHLSGPQDYPNLRERARGFLKATAGHSAVMPSFVHGNQTFAGGYEMMRATLQRDVSITAVFAGNDIIAFGAVRAIIEAGMRVPEDVSIIGFDNVDMASVIHPPLTTIHQPKYEIGCNAVEMLLAAAEHKGPPLAEHRVLPVELIERSSCAPPRTSAV